MKRLPMTPVMFDAWRRGRKSVTRRLINPQPHAIITSTDAESYAIDKICKRIQPYYRPDETVCVVTRWAAHRDFDSVKPSELYTGRFWIGEDSGRVRGKWRPARFVPLHLESLFPKTKILSVRPEWLWDITEEDAEREGVRPEPDEGLDKNGEYYARCRHWLGFAILWNTIHKDKPWDTNPPVWRVEIAPPGEDWRINDPL